MHNTKKLWWIMGIFVVLLFAAATPSYAAEPLLQKPTGSCPDTKEGTPRACVDGLCQGTNIPCNYSLLDIQNTAVGIGNWIFGIIGIVVLVLFIYGGFLWLISGGNSENVNKGKSIIIGSVIGILLVFGAGTIVKLFLQAIGADPEIAAGLPLQGNGAAPAAGPAAPSATQAYACSCITSSLQYPYCKPGYKKDGLGINEYFCKQAYKEYLQSYGPLKELWKGKNQVEIDIAITKYVNEAKCKVVLEKNCK